MKTKVIEAFSIVELERLTDEFLNSNPKRQIDIKFLSFSTNSIKETTLLGFSVSYTGVFHTVIIYDEITL